ncbi:apoptosis-stimulating of p53 protein 2-like isoform X10 [Acanthochromis polyacanthus]|uniref:apoptosis-stimulating of p53 protein 2-like isoform X10 n=1 Tax=Acanthochromis polyacanthus TaxID=80966 RepID=UPI0022347A6E|nr:apoptosis-stimulating of p53 protein 2-like isoform X10 [Acanthochromis polyacanthus]
MMPMFLTVYLSNNDHHFNEVPITPETLCRDVVELCKEPGEADCYLAEMWRGSERVVGDGERMLEVLQRWGQQRGEVRYLLRHQRAPGRDAGGSRAADLMMKRNQMKASVERCLENGVSSPRLDVTLSELQDLATRQQQQINAQQQLLASKEQRLRYLKLQDQRQQQYQDASEQERLRQLRENAHNQEAKLRRVRALRGQVEQKRLSNSKLVEEIEQMTGLFQQKQRELLVAVARVEELSDQLEALRSSRLEPPLPPAPLPHHHTSSSTAELERLYKELQLRNKLNQDQSVRLQQQRDSLNKRNLEVAAMDRRLAELRQRLWKKKTALQQKENLPVASDGVTPQHGGGSRVAAVGPYIQSSSTSTSQGPPVPNHQEVLVKPAYPDGTATLPMPDSSLKPPPRPAKPASGFNAPKTAKLSDWSCSFLEPSGSHSHASTLPRMSSLSCPRTGQLGPRTGQLGPRTGQLGPRTGQLGPRTAQLGPTTSQLGPTTSQLGPTTAQLGPTTSQLGPTTSQLGPTTSQLGPTTSQFGPRTAQLGPTTSQLGPTTSQLGPRTGQLGPRTGQLGPRTGQLGPTTSQLGPRTGQLGPRTGQLGPRTSQLGPRTSQLGPRTSQLGPRTSQLGPRTSQLGPRTSQLGPRTSQLGPTTGQLGPRTGQLGPRTGQLGPRTGGEILSDQKFPSGSDVPPPVPSRTTHTSENLLRDNQASGKGLSKMLPPPLPSKPKPFSSSDPATFSKPSYSTGTFPGKVKPVGGHLRALGIVSSHSNTLPLPNKQDSPPAAAVRPYTPDLSDGHPPVLQKPQTLAASSIYSMYTQQATLGKGYQQGGQGTLPRSQPRVYGKPVLPASGGQQTVSSDNAAFNSGLCVSNGSEADNSCPGIADGGGGDAAERTTPRPLSPTKLLPFLSNPHRNPSDADLEALRRRLHHAPRPLKKRNSITEPEGPAGPNIQKLLYQKTTLAAMETIPMETIGPAGMYEQPTVHEDRMGVADITSNPEDNSGPGVNELSDESPEDALTPPPLPPRSPIPDPTSYRSLPSPLEDTAEEETCPSTLVHDRFPEEFPPYPPPPYPSCGEAEQVNDAVNLQPPEVTGQVTVPPGKRSILHKAGSERIHHGMGVKFNPLALLLDSSLEGEYDLVQRVIYDVDDPSMPNDEGITALHNAVCAGHTEIVKFLVQFGVNVNAADSDGWTPLHCAASCNNVQVCKFLVESGAAVFATTYSDMQTAADKCEEMEDGYAQCSQFLYGVQEKMGVMNRGVVYALWDYEPQSGDELGFTEGDCMTVLRREDEVETEWWWARCGDHEGYIPRNLLGLYLRIKPRQRSLGLASPSEARSSRETNLRIFSGLPIGFQHKECNKELQEREETAVPPSPLVK